MEVLPPKSVSVLPKRKVIDNILQSEVVCTYCI